MNDTATQSFFDRVVASSGVARMIAPFTVTRLIVRAGLTPRDLTPETLRDALPEFERGLRVYLSDDELESAMQRLRDLAA